MDEQTERPTRPELVIAAIAGALVALAGLAATARGDVSSLPAPSPRSSDGGQPAFSTSSCRIFNRLADGTTNVGSGTLIDVTADRRRGLVLSCGHLFTEGTGQVVVAFPSGRTHGARVVQVDRQADLAALEIANPREAPAAVAFEIAPSARLTACGFGPDGEFRCIAGQVVGTAEAPGQSSVEIAGAVRSGDSGGGVFDRHGRLVAVVWGESGGVTYASAGAPLARFVEGLLGGRRAVAPAQACAAPGACPNGRCPLAPGAIVARPLGSAPPAVAPASPPAPQLADVLRRLDELDQRKQDRGDYLLRSDLTGYARAEQLADFQSQSQQWRQSLLGRLNELSPAAGSTGRTAGALATTALGVSGPLGWSVIAGASLGGWVLGRWMKQKARAVRREAREVASPKLAPRDSQLAPPSEATAAADRRLPNSAQQTEVRQPIERDDCEARELLRLSQLEGRDPLQDALAGRLALDRLDALADGDGDAPHAAWADTLRRELRERFNEVAPTKFRANADCELRIE